MIILVFFMILDIKINSSKYRIASLSIHGDWNDEKKTNRNEQNASIRSSKRSKLTMNEKGWSLVFLIEYF